MLPHRYFGSQPITVGIYFKKVNSELKPFVNNGAEEADQYLLQWCKEVEDLAAGEVIITSINHDGRQEGYNIEDINRCISFRML